METLLVVPVFTIAVALFAVLILLHFVPMGLWISALAADVSISLFNLVGMRFRRVEPRMIVIPLIKGTKAGLGLNVNQLEAHYLAGGNVDNVVDALIAAHRAQIDLTFEQAAAIDLAGRNVLEAVQMSVNPKVIETPTISAVAKNGIELKVRARVTVRANIDRLVGGAGEATIIARVGEGIVTTVGSSEKHTDVLENPDHISRTVLGKGLDSGTAFEILSIDIADVDVGRNIGAQLQIKRRLIRKLPRQEQRNVVPWRWRRNRKCVHIHRKCRQKLWKPRLKCRKPWQMLFAVDVLA